MRKGLRYAHSGVRDPNGVTVPCVSRGAQMGSASRGGNVSRRLASSLFTFGGKR